MDKHNDFLLKSLANPSILQVIFEWYFLLNWWALSKYIISANVCASHSINWRINTLDSTENENSQVICLYFSPAPVVFKILPVGLQPGISFPDLQ